MNRYLLDTNIVSEIIRNGEDSVVLKRIAMIGEDRVFTSIIVASEIRYGVARKASLRLTEAANRVLGLITVLPFEPPADECYGVIRADLAKRGDPIGSNDVLIAAQCLALTAILVTDNVREFARVPHLTIENWLAL